MNNLNLSPECNRVCETVYLFDIDGTLCESTLEISPKMLRLLLSIANNKTAAGATTGQVALGVVGGGRPEKIRSQLTEQLTSRLKYLIADNGSIVFINGKLVESSTATATTNGGTYTSGASASGRACPNPSLALNLDLVRKLREKLRSRQKIYGYDHSREIFDIRDDFIYYTPIGNNSERESRSRFAERDAREQIRLDLCQYIKEEFDELDATLGGQVGIGIFSHGHDKQRALNYVTEPTIIYFGDRTEPFGNDHTIAHDPRVKMAVTVSSPEDTYNWLVTATKDSHKLKK